MPSDEDPLKHADVGETHTLTREVKINTIDYSPDVYYGTDRIGDADAVNAKLVETDDGYHDVVLTFEGEVTKQLPYRWNYCEEPRTEDEEQREQKRQWRKKWSRRLSLAIGTVIPVVVATFVTHSVMSRIAGQGPFKEVAAPGLGEIAGMVGGLMLFAAFIMWAIQRLPRGAGGRYA
jgi:hypothetical protein